LVDEPALTSTIVAVIPGQMHVMDVSLADNVEALVDVVSDVFSVSSMVVRSLVVLTLPFSDDSGNTNFELLTSLVRDGPVTFVMGSDGSGS